MLCPLRFSEPGGLHDLYEEQNSVAEGSCSTKYHTGASVCADDHTVTTLGPKFWILQKLHITVSEVRISAEQRVYAKANPRDFT